MSLIVESTRSALKLVGRHRRWKWPLLVALALGVTALEAIGAGMIYVLLTLVSADGSQLQLPLIGNVAQRFPTVPRQTLQVGTAVLVVAFFLVRAGVMILQAYAQARVVHNAGAQVANRLVRGYLAMPYLFHTQHNSAELVRNAFDTAQRFVTQVVMPLVQIMAEGLLVVGLGTLLLVVSPTATALAILTLGPLLWLLLRIVQPRLKDLGHDSQVARQGTLQALQQALGGFRDIRLLSQEQAFATAFQKQRADLARSEYHRAALSQLPRTLIETSLVTVIVAVFVVAVVAGQRVDTLLATLGVFAYVGLRLQPSLQKLVQNLNHLKFGSAVLDDLLEDQNRVDETLAALRDEADMPNPRFTAGIELAHVGFAYSADARPALDDVDLTIRRGEFVGICGPTGGGKSTLIDLLVGLLDPTSGCVRIDGQDLRNRRIWWQAQLGVVSQNIFLIDDSLRANIAFGRPQDEIDEDALQRAVVRAQLDPVIEQLPQGLDTVVGERGIRLSGGQRQRVAIARALYREPEVIVFDEGTSALDTATEAALVSALHELRDDHTLISVAHRISTVRAADRILVIDQGRLVASGTHDMLLAESALFQSLAR